MIPSGLGRIEHTSVLPGRVTDFPLQYSSIVERLQLPW